MYRTIRSAALALGIGGFVLLCASTPQMKAADPPPKDKILPAKVEPGKAATDKPWYKKPTATQFVRFKEDDKGKPLALQVAVTEYAPRDGSDLKVTLIGCVHIGDKEYFEALNKEVEKTAICLYELVAPKGTRPKAGEKGSMGDIYGDVATKLGLTTQMKHVNDLKANLVHADLDFDGLKKMATKRGEDELVIGLRLGADLMALMNRGVFGIGAKDGDNNLLGLMGGEQDFAKLKPILAKQIGEQLKQIEGITLLHRFLILDRNEAAMKELDSQIGDHITNIGILYGAGHFDDMHRRLTSEYDMKVVDQRWLTAWDLTKPVPKAPKGGNNPFEELLKGLGGDR